MKNERLEGMTLLKLHDVITCNFVVSRQMDMNGNIVIPTSQTQIHNGDKLLIVMSAQDLPKFAAVLGDPENPAKCLYGDHPNGAGCKAVADAFMAAGILEPKD